MDIKRKLVELHREALEEHYWADHSREAIVDDLIAHGVTVQEWIPVSERLPEPETEVLTFGPECGYFDVLSLRKDEEEDVLYWESKDGCRESLDDVTHWMTLPEPPKEK